MVANEVKEYVEKHKGEKIDAVLENFSEETGIKKVIPTIERRIVIIFKQTRKNILSFLTGIKRENIL